MRHFIVFYRVQAPFKGNGHFDCASDSFPRRKDLYDHIKTVKGEGEVIEVATITNIVEISEKDYKEWTS